MVVTGAGPGIMAAGNEGAGEAMAIGVNIRLPGEAEPNEWIAENSKLVEMKYFFTRKLMLIKESSGFLVLPGGFGTLDESFELLTLLQTGKAEPAPIVLVDSPDERYWRGWEDFVTAQVYGRGFADPVEAALYRITDDLDEAVREILDFHRNYHSRRFVRRRDGRPAALRAERSRARLALGDVRRHLFGQGDLADRSVPRRARPTATIWSSHRVALEFNRVHHGRLRQLIDALNALAPRGGDAVAQLIGRCPGPPEIVLEPHDVVLVERLAALDLDDDEVDLAGVLDAMGRADRHVDRRSGPHGVVDPVESDLARAPYDEPVLAAVAVALVAEALAGVDEERLHLVVRRDLEDGVVAPGAFVVLAVSHRPIMAAPPPRGRAVPGQPASSTCRALSRALRARTMRRSSSGRAVAPWSTASRRASSASSSRRSTSEARSEQISAMRSSGTVLLPSGRPHRTGRRGRRARRTRESQRCGRRMAR